MRAKLIILLLKLISKVPLWIMHPLASMVARLMYRLNVKYCRTVRTNILRCYPTLSTCAQERRIKFTMVHTLQRTAEMPWFWFTSTDKVLKKIVCVHNIELFEAAKSGALLLAPHHGAWEMSNIYCAAHCQLAALFKLPKQAFFSRIILYIRQQHLNTEMFPISSQGVLGLYKALKQGKCVGIFPDHQPGDQGGVYVPFMGIDAQTMTLVPKIAQKSKVPVLLCYAKRLAWGRGYEVFFSRVDDGIYNDDITVSARTMNQAIEAAVNQFPEQYEWTYKRFRRRPDDHFEPKFYG
jgi:KDO2-lipid IV(A) lauroyltransferase